MIQEFKRKNGNKRLLIYFDGWSMNGSLCKCEADLDIMVCYDYSNLSFDSSLLRPYTDIWVIGWSMGVWAASQVLSGELWPITRAVAINGTPMPLDDTKGIPVATFMGTIENLSEENLSRFHRRMCGSRNTLAEFESVFPGRTFESARTELALIGAQAKQLPYKTIAWSEAYIGEKDFIFLPENQHECWNDLGVAVHSFPEASHYSPLIFKTVFAL